MLTLIMLELADMNWEDKFSSSANAINASEIRELLKILADPEILSFAGGIPDPALFPMDDVKRIRKELEDQPAHDRQSMQYSATEGYEPLRQWICDTRSTSQTTLDLANVLITNGAQQSLTLLASAFMDAGTRIAVANPTYLGALQVFGTRCPEYVVIETDECGLILEDIEAAFKRGVKLLYTIPDFQNPGGMTIPEDRRRRIIELAHQYDVIILEDAAYRDLYYDAPPPKSFLELEGEFLGSENWHQQGLVIQLGTASKTLMPALRVGWTIAPQAMLDKLVLFKQANDLHTSTYNQIIACELFKGILENHIQLLRTRYRERRDAMIETLHRHLPNEAHFTVPEGGMFVWLVLPESMNARDLLEKTLEQEKLAFVPGEAFHANGGGQNTLRLSFATCSVATIIDGMTRLSALIRREHLAHAA